MQVAGHTITDRQLYALHGIYRGQLTGRRVYGVNVTRQLDTLADRGIIARTGMGAYMIPFGSPGADIVSATLDYQLSDHIW